MKFLKIVFIFILSQSIIAQTSSPDQPNTVENQFKELYKKSNNYQIYKVVKMNT